MRIGAGILLIAVGAIIAFAIRDSSGPVNFTVVGIVIMLSGVAGLWLSYRLANQEGESTVIDPTVEDQYRTAPHEYPIDQQIDVTPSHLRDQPRHRPAGNSRAKGQGNDLGNGQGSGQGNGLGR